jgi:hypothetical protein
VQAELSLSVEGPDDGDEFQVPGPRAGEFQVEQRGDVITVGQDVTQVEVPVQQDLVTVRCQAREFPGPLRCLIQEAMVGKRKLPG